MGLFIMVLGAVLRGLGLEVTNETLDVTQRELINLYPEAMEFIGFVTASYGRVKASGGIRFKKEKPAKAVGHTDEDLTGA